MNERITFPEEFISQVVAVIRRGLTEETDPEVREQLEDQCDDLEYYWNDHKD